MAASAVLIQAYCDFVRSSIQKGTCPEMVEFSRHMIIQYGYWMIATLACVESTGIPVPGETALIIGGAYAATSDKMSIWLVVLFAAGGGIAGDNIGYWLGRRFGYWLLINYGHYVWLTEPQIKVGQYLFLKHGRRVVFVARFLPVVREIAAFLAGTNQMRWRPFIVANALGAALWATFYGFGAYGLGEEANGATQTMQIWIGLLTGFIFVALLVYLYIHEKRLEAEAERALPGPIRSTSHARRKAAGRR